MSEITITELLKKCDHTILKPETTWVDVKRICDEAIEFHCASVCIPPAFVKTAKDYVGDKLRICTVIGFPCGYQSKKVKYHEAHNAFREGASELDVVINIGKVKEGNYKYIKNELMQIKELCVLFRPCVKDPIMKVIIEACLLTEEEKIKLCEIITDVGADYIKTSTGFSTGGATVEDVKLFKEHIGPNVKIKAAGGISSLEDAIALVEAGADRLGSSKLVKIAQSM